MIKVTLEFKTEAEAIVALSKVADIVVSKDVAVSGNNVTQNTTVHAHRKPRNDAGKKRGSYKPDTPPPAPFAGTQYVSMPVLPLTAVPAALSPVQAMTQTGAPSAAEAQAAMEKLFNAKGYEVAQGLLQSFKAPRVRDLKPEQRANFIALCESKTV